MRLTSLIAISLSRRSQAYEIESITVHGQTLTGGFGILTSTTDVGRLTEMCRRVVSSNEHAPTNGR